MNSLIRRFRALTLWEKIGFWGAIASFIALPSAVYSYLPGLGGADTKGLDGISRQAGDVSNSSQRQEAVVPAGNVGASGPVNITTGPSSPIVSETKSGDVSITYGK